MRRSDRQLGDAEARDILVCGAYGVLSTVGRDGTTYGVPLSYCVLGAAVYFHCARGGRKLDHLAREPRVSFCVVGATRVFRIDVASLSGKARRA
jgi:uncharacterized protein